MSSDAIIIMIPYDKSTQNIAASHFGKCFSENFWSGKSKYAIKAAATIAPKRSPIVMPI